MFDKPCTLIYGEQIMLRNGVPRGYDFWAYTATIFMSGVAIGISIATMVLR